MQLAVELTDAGRALAAPLLADEQARVLTEQRATEVRGLPWSRPVRRMRLTTGRWRWTNAGTWRAGAITLSVSTAPPVLSCGTRPGRYRLPAPRDACRCHAWSAHQTLRLYRRYTHPTEQSRTVGSCSPRLPPDLLLLWVSVQSISFSTLVLTLFRNASLFHGFASPLLIPSASRSRSS